MNETYPNIEMNDKMLEAVYQLLKRTRRGSASEADCDRWTMLWLLLNAHTDEVSVMRRVLLQTHLECSRLRKGGTNRIERDFCI